MKYYVVYDITQMGNDVKNGILGYHERKSVIKKYIKSMDKSTYHIGQCKEKELNKILDIGDYYLIRLGNTYIQTKYYDLVQHDYKSEIEDYFHCIDILTRIIAVGSTDWSERKPIIKTLSILGELIDDTKSRVLSIDELENIEAHYNEFRNRLSEIEDLDDGHHGLI